jgi:hypothetical protein
MLSVVIPGEIIEKIIYITEDGTVNFLVSDIWAVVDTEFSTGRAIVVADDS